MTQITLQIRKTLTPAEMDDVCLQLGRMIIQNAEEHVGDADLIVSVIARGRAQDGDANWVDGEKYRQLGPDGDLLAAIKGDAPR